MSRRGLLACAAVLFAACSSASAPSAAHATSDPRVRSFRGQVPPEIAPGVTWLDSAPTFLAAQRGRVVYVQFAFPT